MMSVRPLVDVNAISVPSGENFGPVFMPGRSTIVRGDPPSAEMRYRRSSYGAENPDRGAAEYASERPSGAQENPSTNCAGGVSVRGFAPASSDSSVSRA